MLHLGLEGLDTLALTEDFLSFNALDGGGVSQAYILRRSDGELRQLTAGPEGGGVADVYDDFVTYRQGQHLYVAQIGEGPDMIGVPEPATFALFGFGLAGFAGLRRCKRQTHDRAMS